MKLLSFLVLVICSNSFASFSNIDLQQFSLEFDGTNGTINSGNVDIDSTSYSINATHLNAQITKDRQNVKIMSNDIKFTIKEFLEADKDTGSLILLNSNILLNDSLIETDLERFQFKGTTLNNALLGCQSDKMTKESFGNHILNLCLNKMFLSIDGLVLENDSSRFHNLQQSLSVAAREMAMAYSGNDLLANISIDEINNIKLSILKNRFQSSLKFKYIFKFTVKMSGEVQFNENENSLVLHLAKAKMGIISVRKKLLKMIASANIKGVTVQGNYIYWKL